MTRMWKGLKLHLCLLRGFGDIRVLQIRTDYRPQSPVLRSNNPLFLFRVKKGGDGNFDLSVTSSKRIIAFGPGLKDEVVCGHFPSGKGSDY